MVDIWSIIKSGAIEVLIALLNLSRTFQGVDFTNASFMSFRSLQNIYSREYNLCVAYIIYIYKCNTQIYITEGQKHHIYTYIFIYQTYHLPGHSFIFFLFYSVRIIEQLATIIPQKLGTDERVVKTWCPPSALECLSLHLQIKLSNYLGQWLSPSRDSQLFHFFLKDDRDVNDKHLKAFELNGILLLS